MTTLPYISAGFFPVLDFDEVCLTGRITGSLESTAHASVLVSSLACLHVNLSLSVCVCVCNYLYVCLLRFHFLFEVMTRKTQHALGTHVIGRSCVTL